MAPNGSESKEEIVETTAGRIIFNEILPLDLSFINKTLNQVDLKRLEMEVLDKYGLATAKRRKKIAQARKILGTKQINLTVLLRQYFLGIAWPE